MISKEVLEIRKLIKKDSDSSIRVCGCYVAGNEKEKLTYINDYLSNMPDEEQNKYAELLKKTLSGSIGKNLHNLEFTKEAEEEDGQQRHFSFKSWGTKVTGGPRQFLRFCN